VRGVKLVVAVLALGGAAGAIYGYKIYSEHYPSTDNAYVIANVVHVAPQISGQVREVYIVDHQQVTKGDELYRIADEPFIYAVAAAEARLQQARQMVVGNEAAVDSAKVEVERQKVLMANAKTHANRYRDLENGSYVAQQSVDDADADFRTAEVGLAVANAKLNEARKKLGISGDDNQAVKEAQASLDQANWNLEHTRVDAACNGNIAEKNLSAGDMISKGMPNFVLVCNEAHWLEANFKETELAHIHPGQKVDIDIDMYPDRKFHGEVKSIGMATGVAFSLLPPQNASGNWIKVTQRVPVKILVVDQDAKYPLRMGTSGVVRVDTRS